MKKKIFVLTVAILVLAFSLLSFSACTSFNKIVEKTSNVLDEVIAVDDVGTAMYDGKTYDMPQALKFFAASPNTSKTIRLTATISPVSATDQTVDWSLSFVNPSSTWASGKSASDYVSVLPTSDGSLTADVSFVANFGEQILLTVVSRVNDFASATCTIDCYQEVTSVSYQIFDSPRNFSFVFGPSGVVGDFPIDNVKETYRDSLDSTFQVQEPILTLNSSGPYTIPLTAQSASLSFKYSSSFVDSMNSHTLGRTYAGSFSTSTVYSVLNTSYVASGSDNGGNSYVNSNYVSPIDFSYVFCAGMLFDSNYSKVWGEDGYYNWFVSALTSCPSEQFTSVITVTYPDLGSVTYEYPQTFSSMSLGLIAESVSLTQNTIIF